MSKLFKWFKKDKQAKESNEDLQENTNTDSDNASESINSAVDTEETAEQADTSIEGSVSASQALEEDTNEATQDVTREVTQEVTQDETQELTEELTQEPLQESVKDSELESVEVPAKAPEQIAAASYEQQNEDINTSETAAEAVELQSSLTPDSPSDSEPEQKQGLFSRLKASLSRTKENIGSGFSSLLRGKKIDDDLYEELETQLLLADVGMNTTNKIINELVNSADRKALKDGEALSNVLQEQMQSILDKVNTPLDFDVAKDENGNKQPFVILMVGVNGVGKTTTIGKLAKQFQAQGKSVMLAAGDTFRAAAVEQLQVWGERNDIPVVAQHTGADSASVIFDSIESAKAKKVDVLIADTAGRLQNKDNLIEELKKVVRVRKKLDPKAPHEIMLTLDASTGQNAVSQTRIFNEAVGITGINLTKLDGTAKGGVIFALADEFAIPVRYIGIGEGIDDLRAFESKPFVEALFEQ